MPLACYAVLEGQVDAEAMGPWSLNFVRLPYDIEGEIVIAAASDMPDFAYYASELRTGVYRGKTAR